MRFDILQHSVTAAAVLVLENGHRVCGAVPSGRSHIHGEEVVCVSVAPYAPSHHLDGVQGRLPERYRAPLAAREAHVPPKGSEGGRCEGSAVEHAAASADEPLLQHREGDEGGLLRERVRQAAQHGPQDRVVQQHERVEAQQVHAKEAVRLEHALLEDGPVVGPRRGIVHVHQGIRQPRAERPRSGRRRVRHDDEGVLPEDRAQATQVEVRHPPLVVVERRRGIHHQTPARPVGAGWVRGVRAGACGGVGDVGEEARRRDVLRRIAADEVRPADGAIGPRQSLHCRTEALARLSVASRIHQRGLARRRLFLGKERVGRPRAARPVERAAPIGVRIGCEQRPVEQALCARGVAHAKGTRPREGQLL